MKFKLLFFIIFILIQCKNSKKIQNIRNEIEPNDNFEYAQYIDCDTKINAKFHNYNDIDFYSIVPTNGLVMDFNLYSYDISANIKLEIIDFDTNRILYIETKDILNYKGSIHLNDIYTDNYFFKLKSSKPSSYSLSFEFREEYNSINEVEPNNKIDEANIIEYPSQLVYGYFIKTDFDILDNNDYIIPYIKNDNIIDIDFYKIENDTDINANINIIVKCEEDINMILFNSDFKFLKEDINKIQTSFLGNKSYYIALIYYGNKSILNRYTLYYDFINH